jgi:integrase
MAKPRRTASGKWEIGLRHPALPGGRRYFTFDTEAEATNYASEWQLRKLRGIEPPQELLRPVATNGPTLGNIVRQWASSGLAAPSQTSALNSLFSEVGKVRLEDADYTWLSAYVQSLKVKNNLSPNSIRHRIQALGRAIDEYARHNRKEKIANPVRLLPKGYSSYSDVDRRLAEASGKGARVDVQRDRRLRPGEEERIVAALSGKEREDRQRGLALSGGTAMLALFLLIAHSGVRLREGYMLRRGWVDLDAKVMRVQCSKQWRGKVVFRNVPICPELHAALKDYLSTRHLLPTAYLFPFMDEDLTLKTVTQRLSDRFRIAFQYAGIDDLHEHDLRHEATCRWLEMRGADGNWLFRLEEVNKIMGWAAGSTMAQRYASFRGEDLAQRMWPTPAGQTPAKAARGGVA